MATGTWVVASRGRQADMGVAMGEDVRVTMHKPSPSVGLKLKEKIIIII